MLLVDDQALHRMGMRMFLASQDGIQIVGEAADGDDAVRQSLSLRPDVVVMDVRMPDVDGIEATRRIVAATSDVRVLLLTTFDLDEYVIEGLEAGASGFLTKDAEPGDILSALRAIAAGDAVIAPSATRRLLSRLTSGASQQAAADSSVRASVAKLTTREYQILVEIARGATNSEIAARLHLAESTVKSNVGRIFTKIGARDRVHAVILALRAGVMSPTAEGTPLASRGRNRLHPVRDDHIWQ
ncbi:response regulator transcription factor [Polymorphospora sp. NPDC051019]|uniref:response regulator transcription factor n=1 Tax=Polymorphospora sp. NPDC051019 TaxID=3155725 RepID=UPI003442FC40